MLAGIAQRFGGAWQERVRQDRLLRGFGKLGLGELVIRISRLVTAIALARCLDAAELGIAATAIACFELVRVLANNGIGQMVVRASDEHLAATCNTAHRLIWLVCVAMAVIQGMAGIVIAEVTGRPELLEMIAYLCAVYLFMPWGMVQSWLLQRSYRMGTLSAINAAQVGIDNLLVALLAITGIGAWAIIIPKVMTAPIWTVGMRRSIVWKRDRSAGFLPVQEVLRYSMPILASEVLVAVRFNVDKLLVGSILGLEALGVYYFAFSAGYGLSLVLTAALASASFPLLAEARISTAELISRFDRALRRLARPISALILIQSLAVFVYVPILFGAHWAASTMLVSILCLSAATKPWQDLSVQLLRAAGLPKRELLASFLFTLVYLGFFAVGLQFGLVAGVTVLTIATVTMQMLFATWSRRIVDQGSNGSAARLDALQPSLSR